MPKAIKDALQDCTELAVTKVTQARDTRRYLLNSMLAGAYVGVAVVLLASVTGPLVAAGSPFAKLLQGAIFGIALTLVLFAGAELFTGNNMFMVQGVYARTVRFRDLALVWASSLIGNLIGSVAFAALVHGGGSLGLGVVDGKPAPGSGLVASIIALKNAATGPQLFWRAVLCNLLVCLALWMATRSVGDGAKLVVIWWALLAFIASGFEHSVANMTLFSLGVFQGSSTWGELAGNLLWTVPGNVVGGALLVGLVYSYLSGPRMAAQAVPQPNPLLGLDEAAMPLAADAGA